MSLSFNVLTVIFIFLLIFPTQNNDMNFQATITSVNLNGSFYLKTFCSGERTTSDSSAKYFISVYMEYEDVYKGRTKESLFKSEINCSTEYKQTPNTVSMDYNKKNERIVIMHEIIGINRGGEYLFTVCRDIVQIPSKLTFEYLCDPCFDNYTEVSVNGTIRTINKIIQKPFRSCIAATKLFYVSDLMEINRELKQTLLLEQNIKVNDEYSRYSRSYKTSNEYSHHIQFILSGLCESIYRNNSKLLINIYDYKKENGEILIPWTFNGTFNKRMYYSYNNSNVGTFSEGYFEAVTTSTVVGMKGPCKYMNPISCSDGTTTHCFAKSFSQKECIPEKEPNCDNSTCKNGGMCVKSNRTIDCICAEGYYGETCNKKDCKEGCDNGKCTKGGKCSCHSGWSGHDCSTRICTKDTCNIDECTLNENEYECKCNPLSSTGRNCEFKCEAKCSDSTCTLIDGKPTCAVLEPDMILLRIKLEEQNIEKKKLNDNHRRTMLAICLTVVFVIIFAIIIIFVAKKYVIRKDKNSKGNIISSKPEYSCKNTTQSIEETLYL